MVSNPKNLEVVVKPAPPEVVLPGGEDAAALLFGLVGALVLAVLSVVSLMFMAQDPGIAGTILATAAGVYFTGLGVLLWAGAAQRTAG